MNFFFEIFATDYLATVESVRLMNGDQGAEKMVDANLFDIRNGKPSGALNTKIANWSGK